MTDTVTYTYLDLTAASVDVLADGCTVSGADVALATIAAGSPSPDLAAVRGVAGIGADRYGRLYVADPDGNRIVVVECDGSSASLRCPELRRPRGVAVTRDGDIVVADTGNRRVLVLDGDTLQTRALYEGFTQPTDVAVDAQDDIYVSDARAGTVTCIGRPGFAVNVRRSHLLHRPRAVTITTSSDEERVLVLDAGPAGARIVAFRLSGVADTETTDAFAEVLAGGAGIAAADGIVYVGDPAHERVLLFGLDGSFHGVAEYRGPVAGLELDSDGHLVVNAGAGTAVPLAATRAAASGSFRAGPFTLSGDPEMPTRWQILRFTAEVPAGAQIRLYALTTNNPDAVPPDLPEGAGSDGEAGAWFAGPPGAAELLLPNEPAAFVWVGARLQSSDAGETPLLSTPRIDYDRTGWLERLPAVYAEDAETTTVLEALLAGLESALGSEEALIDDLPLLFDPGAAPNPEWLDWLAGWLGFPLDAAWTEQTRRDAVARAWWLNERRGTAEGLRATVSLSLGVPIWISEPAQHAAPWLLGEGSALGFDSMLAPAEAQGAVLGSTAELDRSHLLADEDFGAPLYDDLAHRFCVGVYAADVAGGDTMRELERIVERERPAHTRAHICVVEPRGRVGTQARVGVDAIVAGDAPALALGETPLGEGAIAGRERREERAGQWRVR